MSPVVERLWTDNKMSRIEKPTILICENKGADQLRSNTFVFATSSTRIQTFKLLACFYDYAGRFVSVLVGNPNFWVSHANAKIQTTRR